MSEAMAGFLFFGPGEGAAFEAAALLANSTGVLIDKSEANVAAFRKRGFAAERADLLDYKHRNVARGAFVIDVVQELGGRAEFNQALIGAVRAATDYIIVQHPYFDEDSGLALRGLQVPGHFGKKIKYRPTIADYANFVAANSEGLQISGVAAFVSGKATATPLNLPGSVLRNVPESVEVPKTIRVLIGRKDISRFYGVLDRARFGKQILLWEWL
ncbi:hypothetical protein [Roseomonas chloroacetimidivorans]|uniref:hypothetical protein n=1 Tax=Roseomonas chloroacetimidivorans TaxID=1766656 RepID=UPI003C75BA0B